MKATVRFNPGKRNYLPPHPIPRNYGALAKRLFNDEEYRKETIAIAGGNSMQYLPDITFKVGEGVKVRCDCSGCGCRNMVHPTGKFLNICEECIDRWANETDPHHIG